MNIAGFKLYTLWSTLFIIAISLSTANQFIVIFGIHIQQEICNKMIAHLRWLV